MKLAKGTAYLSLASIIFVISSYLLNIILGRQLGPNMYGIYGIIISLVTAINLTQTTGLPLAVSKYVASEVGNEEAIYNSSFYLQVISTVIVSIIFFVASGVIASILKDPSLMPYLQLASIIFPFYGIFSLLIGYYNGLHKFEIQALLQIVYSILKVVTIIILVYFLHLYGVILGFILSPLIALLIKFHLPSRTKVLFPYKKLISFSIPLIAVAIFANVLQSADLFFVKGITHSDKLAGFYTANQNIAEIPYYALTALASVLFPSISEFVSKNLHREAKNLIAKSLRFTLLLIIPGVLLLSATSASILNLLFSKSYLPGASSLSVLVIGSCFFTIFIILTAIISSSGHPYRSTLLAGIGVVLTCILCILLIPSLGIVGAAWATTVASFIVMVGAGIIVYRKFGVLFNIKSSCKILIASLVIYMIAKVIVLPVMLLPFLYIFLFSIYIGLLFVMNEISKEDISFIRSVLPQKLN